MMEEPMPNIKRTLQVKSNIVSVHFDAAFFFERGVRSFNRNDIYKALRYFQKSADLDPNEPSYLTHLAAVQTELEEYEESNRILSRLVHDIDESLTDCYYYMANNFAHLGEFDQAEQYALMYIKENPGGLYVDEAEELLDFICYELERTPKELDIEHKLIGKHEKARLCLEDGKFVEATKLLEEMVEEYPHFLAARNNLALAYYYLGQYEQAMTVIDEILNKDKANLHALCNLAVFLSHKGEEEKAVKLVEGLKKVQPFHFDHHYKLATTLGILGEDERAYELFFTLAKRGLHVDVSLYHYIAVASFNTQRWARAKEFWLKIKDMKGEDEIAEYYLEILNKPDIRQGKNRLPYHYQLPYDVQIKKKDLFSNGKIPKDLLQDPLIRSSLFWSLRHGDHDTKLQVIQSFEYFADQEIEEALRQIILEPNEEDYIKKVAIFVLRQIGAQSPYRAHLQGEVIDIDGDLVDEKFPEWMAQWQKVIYCLRVGMEGEYDLLEHQEAQGIWTNYLRTCYPKLPKVRKAEGWAAAIEYLVGIKINKEHKKKEIAERYGVSVSTLTRNLQHIEKSIFLDSTSLSNYDGTKSKK
jgi:tetratricopeptide (TPR) repeat protein